MNDFAVAVRIPLLSRMRVEEAADLSDAEIVRTLSGCVAGRRLVEAAKWLRDSGLITAADLGD